MHNRIVLLQLRKPMLGTSKYLSIRRNKFPNFFKKNQHVTPLVSYLVDYVGA